MNKLMFFSGLSFFILEILILGVVFLSSISISKEFIVVCGIGFINLLFGILMLIGALKE